MLRGNRKKQIFIFDFDGTIADTVDSILKISNHLSDEFHFKKILPQEIDRLKNYTLEEVIRHLEIPLGKIPLILSKARRDLHKDMHKVKPISGLSDVLWQLKAHAQKIGIVTTNSTKNVRRFLISNKLDIFDFIHSSSRLFGKGASLKRLMAKRKFDQDNVFYIGDETRDITAAKWASVKTVAVTWGYNSEKILKVQNPDYLARNPSDLLSLV